MNKNQNFTTFMRRFLDFVQFEVGRIRALPGTQPGPMRPLAGLVKPQFDLSGSLAEPVELLARVVRPVA